MGDDVSVKIDRNYRALGILEGDTVHWYWIGGRQIPRSKEQGLMLPDETHNANLRAHP